MASGQQIKRYVAGVAPQLLSIGRCDFRGIEFVLGAGDVQDGCGYRQVRADLPIARYTATYSDDTANLVWIGASKAVSKPDRLGKSDQQSPFRSDMKPVLQLAPRGADHVVVQTDIGGAVAMCAPVVADGGTWLSQFLIELVRSLEGGDNAITSNQH